MNNRTPHVDPSYATELIWDGGVASGGAVNADKELRVVYGGGWTPEHLLLLGAESAVMESFLAAARGADIDVVEYISRGHLQVPDAAGDAPRLTLRPSVVVTSANSADRAAALAADIARTSVAGRLLGDRLQLEFDIRLEPVC